MTKKKQKRSLTLLEIMIVIVLIGLIGSVIGFNVKGSLDEGKAFKTEQAQEQIRDILLLEVARGSPIQEVLLAKRAVLLNSGLIKDVDKFLLDGWGIPFEVSIDGRGDLVVYSKKLDAFRRTKESRVKLSSRTDQPAVASSGVAANALGDRASELEDFSDDE